MRLSPTKRPKSRHTVRRPAENQLSMSVQNGRAFNDWLRAQLKAKKMSQRQLAQQSGVDHSTISRLVRGDRTPSLGTATKLARGLRELRDESETPHYFGLVPSTNSHPTARVEYALRSDDLLERAAGAPGDGVLPRPAHAPPRRCASEHAGRAQQPADSGNRRPATQPQLTTPGVPRDRAPSSLDAGQQGRHQGRLAAVPGRWSRACRAGRRESCPRRHRRCCRRR